MLEKKEKSNATNILIKRWAAHGDVLLASSVLSDLRSKFPKARIDFLTKSEILKYSPYINNIYRKVPEVISYDWIIDLKYEEYPNLSINMALTKIVGLSDLKLKLELYLSSEEEQIAEKSLKDGGVDEADYLIALQSTTGAWDRNWNKEKWERVVSFLKTNYKAKIALLGSKHDSFIDGTIDFRGKLSILQSAALVKRSKLFLGTDSLFMHVAKAFNVPIVILFGSVQPEKRIHINPDDIVIVSPISCRFCLHRQAPPAYFAICEKQNKYYKLLDRLKKKAANNYLEKPDNLIAKIILRFIELLMISRTKGSTTALCMEQISAETVIELISKKMGG